MSGNPKAKASPAARADDVGAVKLTTRVPEALRRQLKIVAAWPAFGYHSQVHMFSTAAVDFMSIRPWKAGFPWRHSARAAPGFPLMHAYLEPVQINGKWLTAQDLKDRIWELCEAEGVNQSTFALTFLSWLALVHRRLPGGLLADDLK